MILAQGGCLCAALRYSVSASPQRVTICHCRFCQRATGSAFLVEPIFGMADFTVTQGTPKVYSQTSEGSGQRVDAHFCETCGTKLFLTFERFPDAVGVYGGTFDDPNWFDRSPDTTKHIFLEVAQKGTVIPAGINTFEAHAMENDGTPIDPVILDVPKEIS